jgi:uracil-DNA glycosylase family 4
MGESGIYQENNFTNTGECVDEESKKVMVDFEKLRKKMFSPYQNHQRKWKQCQKCELCRTRQNVVLARGKVPATVLLVGEAPGASEDLIGKPFVGPAGRLLDQLIEQSLGDLSYCVTNLVGCIPIGEEGSKVAEPDKKRILACRPRLQEIIELVKPKLLVRIGKLSQTYCPAIEHTVNITHPAAILRMDVSQQGLALQRCLVILQDAVASI